LSEKSENKCLRERKFVGNVGASVRDRVTPLITEGDDFFALLGMTKGDTDFAISQPSPHP